MSAWAYAGAGLAVAGGAVALYLSLCAPDSALRRSVGRYVESLNRDLRFLMIDGSGTRILQAQVAVALAAAVASLWLGVALALVPVAAIAPRYWLRRARRQRVERIEQQLDGWLLMLANMLRATGSLGDAIRATADLVHGPLAQELDLALKEIRLGSSLEQALTAMAARIDSRVVSTNVATLLVGRTTGGELATLLEESAAALREMARLEGVVRTKTAQGKAQLFVLVAAPIVLMGAFRAVDPHFFDPLYHTPIGTVVLATAVALWLGALVWARKVLSVDL